LLGEPSNQLVDVDLDHSLAIALAPQHLPSTGAVFGRKSKSRSHWLYYTEVLTDMRQWRLPGRKMVVELRSTGGQTVFPGSIHPSGEAIRWEKDGEPAVVDPVSLTKCLQAIYDEVCSQLRIVPRQPSPHTECYASAPPHILARARRYVAKMPVAISGQGGHDTTYHTACVLVIGFGLDRNDSLTILREWNEHCQPPWSERELEHKIDDALQEPGWRGYLLARAEKPSPQHSLTAIERANRHAIEHRRMMKRSRYR
jgi:hypothetical protein